MVWPGVKDLSVSKNIPELLKSRVIPLLFSSTTGNLPLRLNDWRFSVFFTIIAPAFDRNIIKQ
jgi:hypothetical protein